MDDGLRSIVESELRSEHAGEPFDDPHRAGVELGAEALEKAGQHPRIEVSGRSRPIPGRAFEPLDGEQRGIAPARSMQRRQLAQRRLRLLDRAAGELIALPRPAQVLEQQHEASGVVRDRLVQAARRPHRDGGLEIAVEAHLEQIVAMVLRRLQAARVVGRELADERGRYARGRPRSCTAGEIGESTVEADAAPDLSGPDRLAVDRHDRREEGIDRSDHRSQPRRRHLTGIGDEGGGGAHG